MPGSAVRYSLVNVVFLLSSLFRKLFLCYFTSQLGRGQRLNITLKEDIYRDRIKIQISLKSLTISPTSPTPLYLLVNSQIALGLAYSEVGL